MLLLWVPRLFKNWNPKKKINKNKNWNPGDFPSVPGVKDQSSNAGDTGSVPGRGSKTPQAVGQLWSRQGTRDPPAAAKALQAAL